MSFSKYSKRRGQFETLEAKQLFAADLMAGDAVLQTPDLGGNGVGTHCDVGYDQSVVWVITDVVGDKPQGMNSGSFRGCIPTDACLVGKTDPTGPNPGDAASSIAAIDTSGLVGDQPRDVVFNQLVGQPVFGNSFDPGEVAAGVANTNLADAFENSGYQPASHDLHTAAHEAAHVVQHEPV